MKKILGISLIALFAVSPMVAGAAQVDILTAGENEIGDANKVAAVSYVKGAYNALDSAISSEASARADAISGITDTIGSAAMGTEATTLTGAIAEVNGAVSALENAQSVAIGSAIESANSYTDTQIAGLSATVADSSNGITVSVTQTNGELESLSASINAGGVDSTALATGAVTSTKIADDAVTSAAIADNAVTSAAIATGAVGSDEIAANAVTSAAIAESAVTSNEILDGAIGLVDINSAAIAVASDSATFSGTSLTNQGYVDEKVAGITSSLTSDYATKTGVANTIKAASFALQSAGVTGTVTALASWGSNSASTIAMTGSVTNTSVKAANDTAYSAN